MVWIKKGAAYFGRSGRNSRAASAYRGVRPDSAAPTRSLDVVVFGGFVVEIVVKVFVIPFVFVVGPESAVRDVGFGEPHEAFGVGEGIAGSEDDGAFVVPGGGVEDGGFVVVGIAVEESVSSEHLEVGFVSLGEAFAFVDEGVDGEDHAELLCDGGGFLAFPESGGMPDEFGIFRQVGPIVGEVGEGAFIFVGRGEMGRGFEEDTRGTDVDGLFFDARPDAQIFGCFFEVSEVCRGLAVEEFESESFVDIGGSVSEGLPGDPHGAHGGEGFLGGLGPGFEDAGFWG